MKKSGKKNTGSTLLMKALGYAGGALLVYLVFGITLMFILERQASKFIYVSF